MADNLGVTPGSGASVRAKEINGQKLQYVGAVTAVPTILGYGYAAVTTAVSLPNIAANATHALITVESGGGDLRYRQDGTSPGATPSGNSTAGLRVSAGGAFVIALTTLTDVRVIAVSGTATIMVEYARYDA